MPTRTKLLPSLPNGRPLTRVIRVLVKVDDAIGLIIDYDRHPVSQDLYRELELTLLKGKITRVLPVQYPDEDLDHTWQIFGIV